MTKSKQYKSRVVQDDSGWTTEIIRRVTSKRTVVTKSQGGFATEEEAQAWGESEVNIFLNNRNLGKRKRRRSTLREYGKTDL